MGHGQVDLPRADSFGERRRAAGQPDARLGPAGDLDLPPREMNAAAERLAYRLLPGEASRVVLRRIRPGVAVRALRFGEHALTKAVTLERARDPGDLDQVDAYPHVVSESIQVTPRLAIPLAEIELRTSRSSGPGGQHAQKTETRVEAVFDVAASAALSDAQKARLERKVGLTLRAVAQEERSQWRNRERALERLAEAIRDGLRVERRRRPTAPTAAARERRLEDKRRRGQAKRLRRPPAQS